MRNGKKFVRRIEVHDLDSRNLQVSQPMWMRDVRCGQLFHVESSRPLEESAVRAIAARFFDPVLQYARIDSDDGERQQQQLDVLWRPGVTDNRGQTAFDSLVLAFGKEGLQEMGVTRVATGETYHLTLAESDFVESSVGAEALVGWGYDAIANSLVQELRIVSADQQGQPDFWQRVIDANDPEAANADLAGANSGFRLDSYPVDVSMEDWMRWNESNSWALSRSEIQQIREHFSRPEIKVKRFENGLPENPTDVEMEIIAQSWSEHCKHKIFAATIDYSEESCDADHESGGGGKVAQTRYRSVKRLGRHKIHGLFKSRIVASTRQIQSDRKIDWLSSTFSDNAGMVRFDDQIDVSIKVETHNSPSALDPYGGALTGILGVNRDILGTGMGAKPIANTDVLCFGMPDWTDDEVKRYLPAGLKHPGRIMQGVHKGIEDGGNKSGIPVVNGAMIFDDSYCGKPLVYCGTVGVSPARLPDGRTGSEKHVSSGDLIVMAGGRVGKDGIHGATFSSLELNESSPQSAVQIGDPLTQKRLADFVLAARDAGLYSGLTDNGAGGLSSSVGEMAQFTDGARIDAALVPLKYPGLLPWEVVVSESQERMTIAVPEQNWPALKRLALDHGVEVTAIGEFNDSGQFRVEWDGQKVAAIDLQFLHDELKPMELRAAWRGPTCKDAWIARHEKNPLPVLPGNNTVKNITDDGAGTIFDVVEIARHIMARPNVASKEIWVRRFDHEVQAATAGKPFCGANGHGPADGGVIWLQPHGASDPYAGVAVASGINSKLAHIDTYLSALISMDEAVRNAICSGGDPDMTCLVDNFCWPDPLPGLNNPDHAHKTAQLVRACAALYDTATAWGMPFVSGKDSMKNDFSGNAPNGERIKISVPPTLLITAMAKVPDVRQLVGSDFKAPGDLIFVLGDPAIWPLNASELDHAFSLDQVGGLLAPDVEFPEFELPRVINFYRCIHKALNQALLRSIHDVGDGGLFAAMAESSIGGNMGVQITHPEFHGVENSLWIKKMFHEGPGRFVVSVSPQCKDEFTKQFIGFESWILELGVTSRSERSTDPVMISISETSREIAVDELAAWWRNSL